MHRRVWNANLLHLGTLKPPLAYYALWSSGFITTWHARDSVQTLLWSLEFVIQIILEHDTTITELTYVYRLFWNPGWHYDVISQCLCEPFALVFFLRLYLSGKWIWDLFRVCVCVCVCMCVCVCVLGTRMKESNTSYISNSPPFSQKNLNKKARGLAGTLASKQNKKWEYSL